VEDEEEPEGEDLNSEDEDVCVHSWSNFNIERYFPKTNLLVIRYAHGKCVYLNACVWAGSECRHIACVYIISLHVYMCFALSQYNKVSESYII
jgi:hypothetical protein